VLSTLHTNNAAGAIPRLINLGVSPKIIGSALSVSIAQRLVRLLCGTCKAKDTPTKEEKKIIVALTATIQKRRLPREGYIWRARKCDKCNKTGYKGRIGIFEAIIIDENIEKVTRENPSAGEIKNAARSQGILDMRQDGIIKVLRGITSLEELRRVVDIEEAIKTGIE